MTPEIDSNGTGTIERLTDAVQKAHGCTAKHERTCTVGLIDDEIWTGVIEVFRLEGHDKTHTCYAWLTQRGEKEEIITVLGLPPVDSASSAVRAAIRRDLPTQK